MDKGGGRGGDNRFYTRATALAVAAIGIFAVFYTIDFILEGLTGKIWIVLAGCAACSVVIFLFRRVRGFFNPAFSVPFLIYLLYIAGSMGTGRFTGFFTVFFCICGLAAMYFNRWKFLQFIIVSNLISLGLILGGVPMTKGGGLTFAELLVNWIFSLLGSLFMYLMIQFLSEKTSRSVRSEDSFTTMLSATPDYVVLVDELNCVTHISRKLAEFAHIEDPKMAIGRPLLDLFRDMDIKLKAAEIVDSGGLYEGTWELRLGGESRYFRIISNRLLGDTTGLFISLSDINPVMKARFEAEDAARAKGAFLANTSHEIRTPMNAILGMTELALRKRIPADVHEDLRQIKQAGMNLLAIINDILDFSKIESGKLVIGRAEYRFDSLLNDVLSIIKVRLAEKRLPLITRIDPSLPSVLIGDEVRVRQVLLNLLSNAVKYTKAGDIGFTIYAAQAGEGRITLIFEVADTGVGIKDEDKARLFGEFMRFDSRSNRGVEGTGLGLAISRNLCRLMGGDIVVESEYGKGSVFRASVSQEVKDGAPFAAVADNAKKALICEGRKKQAQALAYMLERLGVPYALAESLEEFVRRAAGDRYDYALVPAPLFDEALHVLKATGLRTIPVCIADYADDPPLPGARVLSMPVQPLNLARLFNGEADIPLPAGGGAYAASFIAPAARLLVVDDIITNLKVAEGLLAPYKAKVDTCISGAEAVELVQRGNYDLVFMDHMMPDMDGIEAVALIRSLEGPGFETLPIIALTANAISGMKEMFLANGFNDFLSKPIEIVRLDEIMEKWIPRTKRQNGRPGEDAESETPEPEDGQSGLSLPGVDTRRGISLTGGTLEGYRQVLAVFRRDAEQRLVLLKNPPEADGLAAFTTQVHALKSAAASLGAAELSADAARLEAAGRAGDLAGIRENLGGFTGRLAALATAIGAALGAAEGDKAADPMTAAPPPDRAFVLPLLADLLQALESQKAGDIDRILDALERRPLDPRIREGLQAVSDQVLMAEFGRAVETLRGLTPAAAPSANSG